MFPPLPPPGLPVSGLGSSGRLTGIHTLWSGFSCSSSSFSLGSSPPPIGHCKLSHVVLPPGVQLLPTQALHFGFLHALQSLPRQVVHFGPLQPIQLAPIHISHKGPRQLKQSRLIQPKQLTPIQRSQSRPSLHPPLPPPESQSSPLQPSSLPLSPSS